MYRAIHLASLAYNATYPNPRVGAVLVHQDRVIGEGFHHAYGEPHAEVKCIQNVAEEDRKFIAESSLYVTLEPCNHQGKTPPCTDLILEEKIPHVVVACLDPHPLVSGQGIEKLKSHGLHVETGFLEEEAYEINKYFMHFWTHQKPYIILKWAEDSAGHLGKKGERISITGADTNEFTMRWRSEVAAIMIGKNTLISDNPLLTNRSNLGVQPTKIILDSKLESLQHEGLHIVSDPEGAYFFNTIKNEKHLIKIGNEERMQIEDIVNQLKSMNITSVIVEGGSQVLQSFLESDGWDEIRRIKSNNAIEGDVPAPRLRDDFEPMETISFLNDEIDYYYRDFQLHK